MIVAIWMSVACMSREASAVALTSMLWEVRNTDSPHHLAVPKLCFVKDRKLSLCG